MLAVLAVVLWPIPVDRPISGEVIEVIEAARHAGATAVTYNRLEMALNVGMFVPLGALGVLAFHRARWWLVVVACLALSTLTELTQLVLLLERTPSVVDIATNTAGALLGALAAAAAIRARGRASSVSGESAAAPD